MGAHEYRVEVRLPSGRWVIVAGTRIYKDWQYAAAKYTQVKTSRPNDKFRIVWRNVQEWRECYT